MAARALESGPLFFSGRKLFWLKITQELLRSGVCWDYRTFSFRNVVLCAVPATAAVGFYPCEDARNAAFDVPGTFLVF